MPTFNSLDQLFKALQVDIMQILQKTGNEIKGVLRQTIQRDWYNRPDYNASTTQYLRTLQLLDSISMKPVQTNGNTFSVEIYYDTSKIIPMDGTDQYPWTRHKSIIDSASSAEALPYYIEYGNGDSPIYQYEGVHPVQTVYEWERDDKYVLNRFKELLRDKGYIVI